MKKGMKIIGISAAVLLVGAAVTSDVLVKKYYNFIDEGINGSGITYSEEAEEALAKGDAFVGEIMKEGITMLKNTSGKAPFAYDAANPTKNRKVNIFGWSSVDAGFIISGYGSGISRIPESKRVLLYGGFDKYNQIHSKSKIEYNPNLKAYYQDFCSGRAVTESLGGDDKLYTNYNPKASELTTKKVGDKTLLQDAKDYSDAAIVVISRQSGENQDCPQSYSYKVNTKGGSPTKVNRSYLSLTEEEIDLLDVVKSNFSNVTVLLNCTNMVECGAFEDSRIQNVYYIGATGQSGARIIPSVLTGDVNPSGRITETCATDFTEDPSYYNACRNGGSNASITYVEDVYVGYRWYETANDEGYWNNYTPKTAFKSNGKTGYDGIVQYPFGSGLSYTSFNWEIESASLANGGTITADTELKYKVKVTNTGDFKGKDVVELYYKAPYIKGQIEKSSICLGDFAKTKELLPGESDTVELSISAFEMASYDCYDKNGNGFAGYELDPGQYTITFRKDVHNKKVNSDALDLTYNIVGQSIRFNKDNNSGNDIKNRFTGTDASNGVALDGSGSGSFTYLSRNNFKNTFSTTKMADYKPSGTITSNDNFSKLPTFGKDAGMYMYTDPNGNKLDAETLRSPTGDKVKINNELMNTLGANYDAPEWETFLDQLTTEDAIKLVVLGGYSNAEAQSVGKIWLRDNDGPMGLTRSNASIFETSKWTWFPMAGLIGNTWNKQLAKDYGKTIAAEGVATGVHGWYAPGANLRRSPFGGRNNEYYSEDPVLCGYIAGNTCLGALEGNMAPYLKHFVMNETETNRGSIKTWSTEQALRELYLRPFEIAIKKYKCNGLMSAFNCVGSTWAGACDGLLTEILRDEWGFRGCVVTDWLGDANTANSGLASGNDLWLNGAQNFSHDLGSNWYTNVLKANRVRRACHNILFQLANTQYIYNSSAQAGSSGSQQIVDVVRPTPYWILAVVGINLILIDGAAIVLYFTCFRKKKENLTEAK